MRREKSYWSRTVKRLESAFKLCRQISTLRHTKKHTPKTTHKTHVDTYRPAQTHTEHTMTNMQPLKSQGKHR